MSSSSPAPRTGGSHPIGPDKQKRHWWLLLLIGFVGVVLLLFILTQCGGDDDTSSTGDASPSTPPASATTDPSSAASSTAPSATAVTTSATPTASTPPTPDGAASSPATAPTVPAVPGSSGSLTAGTTSLLPLAAVARDGSLQTFTGQAVTATGVQVLSVPADEGFWVGTSDTERVWVQIVGSGESPYQVQPGDLVDFSGSMVKHARGFTDKTGVDDAEGAQLLNQQRAHVAADQSTLMLTAG